MGTTISSSKGGAKKNVDDLLYDQTIPLAPCCIRAIIPLLCRAAIKIFLENFTVALFLLLHSFHCDIAMVYQDDEQGQLTRDQETPTERGIKQATQLHYCILRIYANKRAGESQSIGTDRFRDDHHSS
ncbi:MAG: hypothetical protein ACSLEN_13495 [Candidatus Malihini olakiniferum]